MARIAITPLTIALALLSTSSCKGHGRARVEVGAEADSVCPAFRAPVRRRADSIPHERACSYVRSAFEALSSARPESVVVAPADTAAVSSATVDAIAEIDSAGNPVAAWWLVTLRLTGRPYDAEVRFNERTGARSIRPVHK